MSPAARDSSATALQCIFGDGPAVGIFSMPGGCVAHPDRLQALCPHHILRATPLGEMTLEVSLVPAHQMARLCDVRGVLVAKIEPAP